MTDELRAMIDDAVLLMRTAADFFETESYHVIPANMRKLCDELDAKLLEEGL